VYVYIYIYIYIYIFYTQLISITDRFTGYEIVNITTSSVASFNRGTWTSLR